MAIIIRFSVSDRKPNGTLLAPPTQAHFYPFAELVAGAFQLPLVEIDRLEDRYRPNAADKEGKRRRNPRERARDHQCACDQLGEGIEFGVGQEALGQQIVVEEHGRESLDVLELQHCEGHHRKADEPFAGAHRERRSKNRVAQRNRHEGGDAEDHQNGRIGRGLGVADLEVEETPEVVIAADPLAADEGLRRRFYRVFGLESLGFLTRAEPVILDGVTPAFQQRPRLEAVGTGVFRHDHPVEAGGPGGGVWHGSLHLMRIRARSM